MKLTTLLLIATFLQVSATGLAQNVTLSRKNISLRQAFTEINKQTGYNYLWSAKKVKSTISIDIDLKNVALADALRIILKDLPLTYSIEEKTILILEAKEVQVADTVVDRVRRSEDATGIVLDEKGHPLPGATVKVKGTKNYVMTDHKGQFFLLRPDYLDRLIISYVGYEDKEVAITQEITVTLKPKPSELNEVVVAYGRQQQKAITGAVTVVSGEQIRNLPNRSFDESLQGLVPGLVVTKGSGQPGGGLSNFTLRGIATGGDPSKGNPVRNPLIVIDGVPVSQKPSMNRTVDSDETVLISNPLAHLNPADIESISVLKDASAIALYGSKASNGVILVTTKKGRIGKTRFSLSHQTDIANRANNEMTMLNQQQYIDLFVETFRNSYPDSTREQAIAKLKREFPTRADGSFYPQVNWLDAISNKAAITNSTNFSISGGSEKENFYVSLEHTDENGVIKNSGYERSAFRINYEGRPSSWFKYGFNTTLSYNKQDYPDESLIEKAQFMSPLNPIYDESGGVIYNFMYGNYGRNGVESTSSPFAEVFLNTHQNKAYRALSRGYLEARLLKYFTFSSSAGFDFMLNEGKIKNYPGVAYIQDGSPSSDGRMERNSKRTSNIILTNSLSFNKTLGQNHSLNILLGQETQMFENVDANVYLTGFEGNPTLEDVTGGASSFNGGQVSSKQNSVSYFSQLNYGFKDRYFVTGSLRRDGSSSFGPSNRYGTFWSTGVAYVLSEESFLKNKYAWLNYIKFRGSFGPAGNSAAILDYHRLNQIIPTRFLGRPAVIPSGITQGSGNAGIKWEETFAGNVGLDLRLLNNRISFTTDIYSRKTKNFIAEVPMGYAAGFTTYWANIGDMQNRGIELSISADVLRLKNFSWNLNANWSRNTNKLTKSYYPETGMAGTINKVGEEYNSFYSRIWAGVDPKTGRPQWIAKDGTFSDNYQSDLYYTKIGKAQPDGVGSLINSFSYQSFSLSFNLYFSYGSTIRGSHKFLNDGQDPYINQSITALNHWKMTGDNMMNPRRLFMSGFDGVRADYGTDPSSRYFFDGDFIRLSNVNMSYSFPSAALRRLHLDALRVFVQGNNLALWTPYSGSDPENINVMGSTQELLYPQARTYSAGLNLSF